VAALRIDGARVQTMLDRLHAVGAGPTGTFRGVYSPAWRDAQALIKDWMAAAGLDVRVDAVGNVWGHLAGQETGPPIVAGSHFDTVPNGGKYDGQLGHVGAVVAVEALRRQLGQPRRPIAVLAACEEEGTATTPTSGRRGRSPARSGRASPSRCATSTAC
jgi:allantoate deiminase